MFKMKKIVEQADKNDPLERYTHPDPDHHSNQTDENGMTEDEFERAARSYFGETDEEQTDRTLYEPAGLSEEQPVGLLEPAPIITHRQIPGDADVKIEFIDSHGMVIDLPDKIRVTLTIPGQGQDECDSTATRTSHISCIDQMAIEMMVSSAAETATTLEPDSPTKPDSKKAAK